MDLGTTKSLSLRVLLTLCCAAFTCGYPVPFVMYPPLSDQSPVAQPQLWEVRPASMRSFTPYNGRYDADAQAAAVFNSYLAGRFDPDRPYIQMIVPGGGKELAEEEKGEVNEDKFNPGGPFGPTRPSPPPPPSPTTEAPTEEPKTICNETALNATGRNETNATDCVPPTVKTIEKPGQALFMLADGTTVYSVSQGEREGGPNLSGAYELAYVAHRPSSPYMSTYPMIQYADHAQMQMDTLGRVPFFRSPYSAPRGYYEPVYIYRPVYPSASRSYDVYYYLPSQENEAETSSEDQSEEDIQEVKEEEVVGKEDEVAAITAEDLAEDPGPSAEKVQANEIAMPNAVKEEDQEELQEQALVDALSSEIEAEMQSPKHTEPQPSKEVVVEAEEAALAADEPVVHDDKYWDSELEKISDKDLIHAVEIVLQQLNSRLSD